MRKLLVLVVLVIGLVACAGIGWARDGGIERGVIDGRTADRVHLREKPSADSKSKGLYFTGTEVRCSPPFDAEWIWVNVGSEGGYMKAEYLRIGADQGSVQARQPKGIVGNIDANSWANLRADPGKDSPVAATLRAGDTITVLGETATLWYYVQAGEQAGYLLADYLIVGEVLTVPLPEGCELALYTAVPNAKSSIRIEYPRFTGAQYDALNALIYQKVLDMSRLDPADFPADTGLSMDYETAVTLKNSRVVSIIFWGYSEVERSAHPFTDLIAYNIDLATLQEIALAQLYTVDANFAQVFFQKAAFPQNPVTSYDAVQFPEMLEMQREGGMNPFSYPDSFRYFLKPEGIVLSMSSVHATGSDHIEAQLAYGDIQQFYRMAQNIWEGQ